MENTLKLHCNFFWKEMFHLGNIDFSREQMYARKKGENQIHKRKSRAGVEERRPKALEKKTSQAELKLDF